MAQDQSAEVRPDRPEIVEWGDDDVRRPARIPRALAGHLRDRRLVPMIAGLGLVAVFASLVGEWTVLTIPNQGPENTPLRVPLGVDDIATYGAAYLVGELALTTALALVLFGAPAIRHNSRIVGIATAGGLLGLLAAATLDESAPWPFMFNPEIKIQVEHGRGLVMAYAGTAALGLALYLAGRFIPSLSDAAAGRAAVRTSDADDLAAGNDWRWRRRGRARVTDADDGEAAPVDLTVSPTTPFALPEQQDRR